MQWVPLLCPCTRLDVTTDHIPCHPLGAAWSSCCLCDVPCQCCASVVLVQLWGASLPLCSIMISFHADCVCVCVCVCKTKLSRTAVLGIMASRFGWQPPYYNAPLHQIYMYIYCLVALKCAYFPALGSSQQHWINNIEMLLTGDSVSVVWLLSAGTNERSCVFCLSLLSRGSGARCRAEEP